VTPVLWLTGPPGVGKSTAAWQLFADLSVSGFQTGFADADQLCICYPAPADDPGRDLIRAAGAAALIRNFAAAGAQRVIINGCVNPGLGVRPDLLAPASVLVCRLRADRDELAQRLTGRTPPPAGDLTELVRQALEDADRLDASTFADVVVDTTGVPAGEVARLVRERCRDWAGFGWVEEESAHPASSLRRLTAIGPPQPASSLKRLTAMDPAQPGSSLKRLTTTDPAQLVSSLKRPIALAEGGTAAGGGNVLLLCGPAGVGKSTIGFLLYQRCLRAGLTAGYVDLDQIGFLRPGPDGDLGGHRLRARNLAAMWAVYQAGGASHLVVSGPVDSQAALRLYQDALPGASITICRLHAGPAELRRRVMTRGAGGSWPQPGDPLRGQPASYLSRVADQAIAHDQVLEEAGLDAVRVDTTGRSVTEAAGLVAVVTGWPGQ
jgi:hypothetical protein